MERQCTDGPSRVAARYSAALCCYAEQPGRQRVTLPVDLAASPGSASMRTAPSTTACCSMDVGRRLELAAAGPSWRGRLLPLEIFSAGWSSKSALLVQEEKIGEPQRDRGAMALRSFPRVRQCLTRSIGIGRTMKRALWFSARRHRRCARDQRPRGSDAGRAASEREHDLLEGDLFPARRFHAEEALFHRPAGGAGDLGGGRRGGRRKRLPASCPAGWMRAGRSLAGAHQR